MTINYYHVREFSSGFKSFKDDLEDVEDDAHPGFHAKKTKILEKSIIWSDRTIG